MTKALWRDQERPSNLYYPFFGEKPIEDLANGPLQYIEQVEQDLSSHCNRATAASCSK